MKYSKYFSLEMNREKSIFHFEKQNFEPIGNSVHTTEYQAFAKALLARLHLKVHITNLLSVYITLISNFVWIFTFFEDFSDLENLILLKIELTLFLQFCFLDAQAMFSYQMPLFSPQLMKRKRNKNEFFKYFCRILPRKKKGIS